MKSSNTRESSGDKRERAVDMWPIYFPLEFELNNQVFLLTGSEENGLTLRQSNLLKVTSVLNFILFSFPIFNARNKEQNTDICMHYVTTSDNFTSLEKKTNIQSLCLKIFMILTMMFKM
jgi:hypothetical protein